MKTSKWMLILMCGILMVSAIASEAVAETPAPVTATCHVTFNLTVVKNTGITSPEDPDEAGRGTYAQAASQRYVRTDIVGEGENEKKIYTLINTL